MIGDFELAQINIGRLKAPTDAPKTRGFNGTDLAAFFSFEAPFPASAVGIAA